MHEDLKDAVNDLRPELVSVLADLVRIPSVSAPSYAPGPVRQSAEAVASLLTGAGASDVQLLELDGVHPAVFAQIPGPPGTPTVLLYAHHDVQPPGPDEQWETGPFDPFERDGRLYGRGASDDKSGVVMHLGTIKAFGGRPPLGIKVFIEGEEEIGSQHLPDFLTKYSELLAADVIVIADAGNWRVGQPALTTSLRGITACVVEVRTLASAVHSGQFGGAFPDALTALCRLISTLHDEKGDVAVPGLIAYEADPLDLTEEELRSQVKAVEGLQPIGEGAWTSRLWTKPAISVLAIDAPPISQAINQLVPVARAKVSMRIAPGQDGQAATDALRRHLLTNVPWGAQVTVESEGYGDAFSLDAQGPAYQAFAAAMREAWGVDHVEIGAGGSIPFVAAFSEQMPGAPVLLTGAGDPTSAVHGPNESQDLDDLEKSVLAEAIALRLLAPPTVLA
ncbi:MAG: dipeptidase [Acidimicrobiia bacterium]|nr:dipeptidase [Acidimicrobiia bacterium]